MTVTADFLTGEESREVFGADLTGDGIQPVWIEIENSGLYPYWFVPHRLDPEYYLAMEIANIIHGRASGNAKKKIYEDFYDIRMTRYIPPGETRRGFVFTKYEQVLKHLAIKIIGKDTVKQFYFALEIPGPDMDFQKVDFDYLFEHQVILDLDLPDLRRELEKLPCCTTDPKGMSFGDPLNLVIVGDRMLVMSELLSCGWNLTETIRAGSVYKMILSSVFGKRYLTAPVSPLYFQARQQDFAMQKTRSDINRRNHLRLWLSLHPAWRGASPERATASPGGSRRRRWLRSSCMHGVSSLDSRAAERAAFEEALRVPPEYHTVRTALWQLHTGQGEHQRALAAVTAIRTGSVLEREGRFAVAMSLMRLKRDYEAFGVLRTMQSGAPMAAVSNAIGVVQLRRGATPQTGRATYYFNQATELDPADATYFFNLGYAYWLEKDANAAVYWLREAVRRTARLG